MSCIEPWRFFRIRFALWISFLHSAIFSWADVILVSVLEEMRIFCYMIEQMVMTPNKVTRAHQLEDLPISE